MGRKKPTLQYFEDLYIDAMGGDTDAEREYRDLARLLAKRSNQQMLSQERAEVTSEAWRRAQEFLGYDEATDDHGKRFLENNKKYDLETLHKQVDEMMAFQNSRDYSIPYARQSLQQIDAIQKQLAAAGVDIEDARVTFWMNEMFKTDAWKEFKKAHGRSTNLIQSAQDQFQQGKTVDDLIAAYNDYASGRDDAPDLVQAWERFAPDSW